MHEGSSGFTEPDIGDIVHYRSRGSSDGKFAPMCVAAVVTLYHGQRRAAPFEDAQIVSLAVLNPAGLFFQSEAPQDETRSKGGTWHWTHRNDR
jgi:hypothetical protein